MPKLAMEMKGVSKEQTAVVGDRIYTDIKSGINAGCISILVMSGETTKEINIMVLENYHKTENQISNIIRLYTHLKRKDPPV